MARIEIDTGVATTTTVKAAFDDINVMTAELYAALGDPNNMVSLGTYGLRRTTAFTAAPNPAAYATVAVKFRCPTLADGDGRYILGDNGSNVGIALSVFNELGAYILSATLRTGVGSSALYSTILNSTVVPGQTYVIHFAADSVLDEVRLWANGVAEPTTGWAGASAAFNFTLMTHLSVGCGPSADPATTFNDLLGFVYIGVGNDPVWKITDPAKFYSPGGVYLGPSGQTPNLLQPMVFLGGTHLANDWVAGTNFGYGGNFTYQVG